MNWLKRLFGKTPAPAVNKGIPEIIPPVIYIVDGACGGYFNGHPIAICGRPQCQTCNPMTRERAAAINERFLRERNCKNQTCCGSCPGGCTIGKQP